MSVNLKLSGRKGDRLTRYWEWKLKWKWLWKWSESKSESESDRMKVRMSIRIREKKLNLEINLNSWIYCIYTFLKLVFMSISMYNTTTFTGVQNSSSLTSRTNKFRIRTRHLESPKSRDLAMCLVYLFFKLNKKFVKFK